MNSLEERSVDVKDLKGDYSVLYDNVIRCVVT